MSLRKSSGWVAECNMCRDEVSEYLLTKRQVLAEIVEGEWFRHGSLIVCWRCLRDRQCRIFGHSYYRSASYGQNHCRRCHGIEGD